MHTLRASADDVNRFAEANETNNQFSAQIAVGTGATTDTTAPVISGASPAGTLAAGTSSIVLSLTTNETAQCRWGTDPVTAYDALPNSLTTTSGTFHTSTLTGFADGQTYLRYVRCRDGAGNANTTSTIVTFSVGFAGPAPVPPAGPVTKPGATILWHDAIQTGASPWGFDGLGIERPIGVSVSPSDAIGVNLSKVADPLSPGGFAIRHYATFDNGGSRAQAGIYSFANSTFNAQAKSAQGIWVAQEWYFPQTLTAQGDDAAWMNLWDWHSTDAGGGNRWHTSPGLMLAEDGSMKVKWEWGGPSSAINSGTGLSAVALPVGRWFDVEMHYTWTTGKTTLSLWVDGVLALEQPNVQTRAASHDTVETYMKFYGSNNGGAAWSPGPSVKYTRNVRIAGERIWR
jgi:hypothetical protein